MTNKKDGDMDSMGNKARPRSSVDSSVASNKTELEGILQKFATATIDFGNKADATKYLEAFDEAEAKILALLSTSQREAEQRMLDLWKGDILSGFTPKCLFCGTKRKVVGQTTKGKDAQDKNHLPRNWGYYCQDCYNEGSKIEYEAMYG